MTRRRVGSNDANDSGTGQGEEDGHWKTGPFTHSRIAPVPLIAGKPYADVFRVSVSPANGRSNGPLGAPTETDTVSRTAVGAILTSGA
jgi:hypothetical protein